MSKQLLAVLTALIVALFAGMASAAPTPSHSSDVGRGPDQSVGTPPADPSVAGRLAEAKHGVIALQQTADAGIITRAQANEGTQRYLADARAAAGHDVTLEELMAAPETAAAAPQELTALQRFAGLVTFVNVLWVLGIGVGVLCFAFLFGSFVVDLLKLLKEVPLVVYEVLFYGASVALVVGGHHLGHGVREYVGLTGCLAFAAALGFTSRMRKFAANGFRYSAMLFVAWTAAALWYAEPMLGFISVAALLSALGFSVIMSPLCYCIGFEDEASVGKATSAAFLILASFVGIRALKAHVPALATFEGGALFLGSFVGYLGLLISASRWYRSKKSWALMQVVTIVAGIAALFVGSYLGIGELQKIGGTFFVLYLLEKPMEIPASSARGYAAVGLVTSLFIFGFCMFLKENPETLRPYVFMFR